MRISRMVQAAMVVAMLSFGGVASASDAKTFLQQEQAHLSSMLQKSASQNELSAAMALVIDYDALTQKSFGEHWTNGDLNDAQKNEVKGLLRTLIENNYKKNLKKILNYKADFGDATGEDSAKHVKMKAQSTSNSRDKATIEYILRAGGSQGWTITEFIVEGSRTSANYYRQFHEMLTNKDKGYGYLVQKLKDSIAKG